MKLKYKTLKYSWLIAVFIMVTFPSCDKYLSERPSKNSSLVVTTTDQLDALLNAYSTFYTEGNRTAVYSTDDYGFFPELYNARPGVFSMAAVEFGLWDIPNLPNDGREVFWSNEYKKIFSANLVLSYVDKVSGSDADKKRLVADAYFIRAYSYWVLANTYCLPYTDANKGEAGLPLKRSTSFDEPFVRATLEQTYQFIESDLTEALKCTTPLVQNGKARHWRANTAGVNGFAARYWLNRNDYTKALSYANAALAEYSTLVDYNIDMRYGIPSNVTINPGPSQQVVTLQFPYTHNNQTDMTDMIGWKEFLYFRMLNHESWWYVPSQELLNLYDKTNDLRYKYHMVQHYSYDRTMTNPAYDYPGYVFFFKDRIPSGPTTAEMTLIKAECLARTGQVAPAMAAVNVLYSKRTVTGTPALTASTQPQAIQVILQERRREMPFTQRWFDIRRFNNNNDPSDDVVLTKTFYPYNASSVLTTQAPIVYTLPKDSRRFAAPLPQTEIISSNGVVVQNTY